MKRPWVYMSSPSNILLLKVCPWTGQQYCPSPPTPRAKMQDFTPLPTCWISICSSAKPPGDLCTHENLRCTCLVRLLHLTYEETEAQAGSQHLKEHGEAIAQTGDCIVKAGCHECLHLPRCRLMGWLKSLWYSLSVTLKHGHGENVLELLPWWMLF